MEKRGFFSSFSFSFFLFLRIFSILKKRWWWLAGWLGVVSVWTGFPWVLLMKTSWKFEKKIWPTFSNSMREEELKKTKKGVLGGRNLLWRRKRVISAWTVIVLKLLQVLYCTFQVLCAPCNWLSITAGLWGGLTYVLSRGII